MLVNYDSIISNNEREKEVESKLVDDSERGIENMVYISVRGRHCSDSP